MRPVFLACIGLLLLSVPAIATESPRTITVTGTASISAEPEYARLQGTLKIVRPTVKESYMAITAAISEMATALQPLGISREQFIASIVQQGTEYQWQNNTRTVVGYFSACSVTLHVANIADTYRIHAQLAEYPELTIGSTGYGRSDEAQLQISALKEALDNARAKAQAMAESFSGSLGAPLHISEQSFFPGPVARLSAQMADSAPVDPGEVSTTGTLVVNGNVTVEFALQ